MLRRTKNQTISLKNRSVVEFSFSFCLVCFDLVVIARLFWLHSLCDVFVWLENELSDGGGLAGLPFLFASLIVCANVILCNRTLKLATSKFVFDMEQCRSLAIFLFFRI